jgi:hypothetical protein
MSGGGHNPRGNLPAVTGETLGVEVSDMDSTCICTYSFTYKYTYWVNGMSQYLSLSLYIYI